MALCRPPALRGEGLPLTQGRPGWARDTRSLRAWTWSSSRLRLLGSPLLPGVSDAGLLVPAGAQGAPLGAVRVLPGGFRRQDASRQPFKLHCVVRTFLLLLSRSVVSDSATSRTAAGQPSLYSQSLLKLMSIESVMPSSHLILCHPLLLLPSVFPSIRVFPSESAPRIRWPKYWSFSCSISPSNEHPGPISFRMDWLDLLAVQGTLRSLLQHHSSKASALWGSAFFMVQLSHPYMTGKAIVLTRQTFSAK